MTSGDALSTTQVAQRLGVTPQTVRRTLERLDLPFETVARANGGTSFRIPPETAARLEEELGERHAPEWGALDDVAAARHTVGALLRERDEARAERDAERLGRVDAERRVEILELRQRIGHQDRRIEELTGALADSEAVVADLRSELATTEAEVAQMMEEHAAALDAFARELRAQEEAVAQRDRYVAQLKSDHAELIERLVRGNA